MHYISQLIIIFLATIVTTISSSYNVTTRDQLITFKAKKGMPDVLSWENGASVPLADTQTLNKPLIFNTFFMESITQFTRELIPLRPVHGKGYGVCGYFQVTRDLSDICRAKVFHTVGKKTPIAVRFSSHFNDLGFSDLLREPRGYAIKFYTEEGNLDLLALTMEMFHFKDPVKFPDFVHAFGKNPKTHVTDPNSIWDFLTANPETLSSFLLIFGDRGIPDGYRGIFASCIHTFELINDTGERHYVKFHFVPDEITTLTTEQAQKIQGYDLDYANRDVYNAIINGNYPTWAVSIQIMSQEEAYAAGFDVFDVTIAWPKSKYPLQEVGRMYLNEIPDNQFAEVEQLAFTPGNLVPGIRGVDKLFEGRLVAYRESHNYRLGVNTNKIPVNCPLKKAMNYLSGGVPPVQDNGGESPTYFSNSFGGPRPVPDNDPPILNIYTDPRVTNFDQAAEIYEEMSDGEKCRMVENIVKTLGAAEQFIQDRAVALFKLIHEELGARIVDALQKHKVLAEFDKTVAEPAQL